jgi:hypothetical protein
LASVWDRNESSFWKVFHNMNDQGQCQVILKGESFDVEGKKIGIRWETSDILGYWKEWSNRNGPRDFGEAMCGCLMIWNVKNREEETIHCT